MHDPFVGGWTLNVARSDFDPNHRPMQAKMTWELDADGSYLLLAEGTNETGTPCSEKPQRLFPNGNAYPVENLPGLTCVTTRPNRNVIRAEVKREDGSLAGEGTYVVADDAKTMVATTIGFDSQLRQFKMRTVWDRL
jgi:hypothetical protein